jgi:hypothetical protein
MRTTVCGYVFADSKDDSHNIRIIDSYPYDPVYPFPAAFAHPRPGYEGSTIAFATSMKATRAEWDEWHGPDSTAHPALCYRSSRPATTIKARNPCPSISTSTVTA